MWSGRNRGKGERQQYCEGLTVLSLTTCSRWYGWRGRNSSATRGRPASIPSRNRSATYGRWAELMYQTQQESSNSLLFMKSKVCTMLTTVYPWIWISGT